MFKLPEAIAQPTRRQLRQFAAALPLAVFAIAWMLGFGLTPSFVACIVSAIFAVLGRRHPSFVKPIYVSVSVLAYPIGLVVSELVMLTVYFGLITPIGLVFRCMGRDALQRAIDRDASSYWGVKKQADSVSNYLRRW